MAGGLNGLPRLREDLQLLNAGPCFSGAPAWVIHDPAASKFYRITFEMFQLLSLWNRSATPEALGANVENMFGRHLGENELESALKLADSCQLLDAPSGGGWQTLYTASKRRHGFFQSAIHNYLFFKLPLVRPQKFLAWTWHIVAPLFTRAFLLVSVALGLIGLYFASRQWDAFVHSFPYFFTAEGLAVSVLSVVLVKSLHELGHGYMAHRYGCQVPTMGLAFMVLVPMLYTDVSQAWRLKSRRQRILIDSAGILVELCLGMVCLFLWAFLPDGPIRSAAFVIATVSWLMSLAVNLNPMMRFDGYYIASDLLDVPNLQSRSFAHLSWRLRRFLFDLDDEPPERFPRRLDAALTLYAIATAIYRVLLYIGIALLVYHFFIKAVGIALFAIEVVFFILRPIWAELRTWWTMRKSILAKRRSYVTAALLCGAAYACFLPISATVYAPAMLEPENYARLYPEAAGRIDKIAVKPGDMVQEGDLLFSLASPPLAYERRKAETEIALRELRVGRGGADSEDREDRIVIEGELAALRSKLAGLAKIEARLAVRAPFDGRIAETNSDLYVGRWITRQEQLGLLTSPAGAISRGYVDGDALPRIAPGSAAVFIPDDLTEESIDVVVDSIGTSGARDIEIAALASLFGGPIAVVEDADRRMAPVSAQYAIEARAADGAAIPIRAHRGMLQIDAAPESVASRAWRQVLKVLVRESGA